MTTKDNGLFKEIENRLADLLDDFMGGCAETWGSGDVSRNAEGHGVTLRIIGPEDRLIQVSVAIEDVTEELDSPAPADYHCLACNTITEGPEHPCADPCEPSGDDAYEAWEREKDLDKHCPTCACNAKADPMSGFVPAERIASSLSPEASLRENAWRALLGYVEARSDSDASAPIASARLCRVQISELDERRSKAKGVHHRPDVFDREPPTKRHTRCIENAPCNEMTPADEGAAAVARDDAEHDNTTDPEYRGETKEEWEGSMEVESAATDAPVIDAECHTCEKTTVQALRQDDGAPLGGEPPIWLKCSECECERVLEVRDLNRLGLLTPGWWRREPENKAM